MRKLILAALAGALVASPLAAQAPAIADHSLSTPINGTWRYAGSAGGGEARLSDAAGRVQLTLTCQRSSRIMTLARPAAAATPFLQVWTSSQRRNLPASFNPATNQLRASLSANDGLLDALSMSRGRMAVGIAGQPALIAPVWGEIGRVIEECRV